MKKKKKCPLVMKSSVALVPCSWERLLGQEYKEKQIWHFGLLGPAVLEETDDRFCKFVSGFCEQFL